MANWKYVMMQVDVAGTPTRPGSVEMIPVLFPPEITHMDMAEAMMRSFSRKRRHAIPRSAGFVSMLLDTEAQLIDKITLATSPGGFAGERIMGIGYVVWCHGESESLHMKPHPEDAGIIFTVQRRNQFFYD